MQVAKRGYSTSRVFPEPGRPGSTATTQSVAGRRRLAGDDGSGRRLTNSWFIQQRGYVLAQPRKFALNNIPDEPVVHIGIAVNENVAKSDDAVVAP